MEPPQRLHPQRPDEPTPRADEADQAREAFLLRLLLRRLGR